MSLKRIIYFTFYSSIVNELRYCIPVLCTSYPMKKNFSEIASHVFFEPYKSVVHVSLVKNNKFFISKENLALYPDWPSQFSILKKLGWKPSLTDEVNCGNVIKGGKVPNLDICFAHIHRLPGILKGNQGVSVTFEPHKAEIHQKRWKRWILICRRHIHKTKGLIWRNLSANTFPL